MSFTLTPTAELLLRKDGALKATIAGEPKPKERPRFARGRAYTPASTKRAEAEFARQFREKCLPRYGFLGDCPFEIYLDFYMSHRGKPDVDNLTKLALDALNGVAFADDRQCLTVHAAKHEPDGMVLDPRTRNIRKRRAGDPLTYGGERGFACTLVRIKPLRRYAWDEVEDFESPTPPAFDEAA